jgi:hypothetical protein
MELLTPSAKPVKEAHHKKLIYVSFRKGGKDTIGLCLTSALMRSFVLRCGMRLTFVVDVGRLYFYLSPKGADGFLLTKGKNESAIISSRLLVRTIYERLPAAKRNGTRYPVRVSNTRINDCATFEILLDKQV